jgi:hypothetical protein
VSAATDSAPPSSIAASWWPLAASWLLMAAEQPTIAAVVARLPAPEIHLAAWGGVVFSFALVIEAPIIMMLAASTELVRDRASHVELRRFTHRAGFVLTALHVIVVATPLFDLVVGDWLGVPAEIRSPSRTGLAIVVPWTWSIAWRRFNQGILIRFGHARAIGFGTALRLGTTATTLALGAWLGAPGVVVAASGLAAGVIAEAIWAAWRVRSVVHAHLRHDDAERPPLRGRAFWAFYLPLSLTPLVTLIVQPLGTASLTRMPEALPSLAVWPVVNAIAFVLSAPGLAFNEVVVARWASGAAQRELWRFTLVLAAATTAVISLLAFTPLATVWFGTVAGLSPPLQSLAVLGLALVVPVPATRVLQSWYQGVLVANRRTSGVSESVAVFAITSAGALAVFVAHPVGPGLLGALIAFTLGRIAQTAYLALRCRGVLRRGNAPDGADVIACSGRVAPRRGRSVARGMARR